MIPKEVRDSLSPEERSMLESLETAHRGRGISIGYESGELIFIRDGQITRRRPLSYLRELRQSIKVIKTDPPPDA